MRSCFGARSCRVETFANVGSLGPAAGRCAKALRAKKALQALLSSACFCFKQLSTFAASGMRLLHSLNASGAHAALCQGALRFSSAEAVAAQTSSDTAKKRRLKRSIISDHSSGALLVNFIPDLKSWARSRFPRRHVPKG
jgi:hypothetical protein